MSVAAMKILYVENHARFARITINQFLKEHDVTVATTAADAEGFLSHEAFDAVLVDYDLEDGNGIDVVRSALATNPRPRIIAISAKDPGNEALLDAGADAACSKLRFNNIADYLTPPEAKPASTAGAAGAFERFAGIVARLRAPDGCPWDREQTHMSLRPYLLEEAAEVLEAIETGDTALLREELGDLILQPVLHAQIAADQGDFNIAEVLNEISDKLIRRHPHVFGEVTVDGSGEVLKNWDAIKKQEKAAKGITVTSILDEPPHELPALAQALKISKKAAKVGFEWPDIEGVFEKLKEETAELEAAIRDGEGQERISEEIGDLLFTAVNIARWQKVNPEMALRDMVRRFMGRFRAMEAEATERGVELEGLSAEEWEELWLAAKRK
jgi:MazG family protein